MFRDYKTAYLKRNVKVREEVPMSFLRQSVSYLLSQSARKIPHAAGIVQMDVTNLVEYGRGNRTRGGEQLDEKGVLRQALNRNFSAFFVKAFAHGLHHVPCLNGFLDFSLYRDGGTLYQAEDINFSFTVHTKWGVVRPVVRNPHQKELGTVALEMRDLARRARRTDTDRLYRRAAWRYVGTALRELDLCALPGLWMLLRSSLAPRTKPDPAVAGTPLDQQLQPEEVLGATVTMANIGMMIPGHQTVTVIIPPEVTMFGIGDLHLAPLVVDGEIAPRWVVTMCATMDHRAYDAGEAFPFYQHIRRYVDNPALIYEWKPGDPI